MEVSHISRQGQSAIQNRWSSLQRRHQRLRRKHERANEALATAQQQLLAAGETIRRLEQTIACKQVEIEAHSQQRQQGQTGYFRDPAVYGHRYAASMIALCVNLANVMPLRTIPKALQIILSVLGIKTLVPNRETITRWCKRLGLDRVTQNQTSPRLKSRSDMIWIVDHSNQIGTQKVLVILGIPASELPALNETLSLDKLEVLMVRPGESWTRDDVRAVYRELAAQIGCPRWVLCDGAVELRESVDALCDEHHTSDVLRDFKHFAANRFESLIGRSEEFQRFLSAMGKTRCLVQQTELAHLTPPSLKTKARFMNIEPMIAWGEMILAVLEDPRAPQSGVLNVAKLEQRLGWLREYREQIASWKRCCDVIGSSLWWINTHALQRDTQQQLRGWLEPQRVDRCELSDRMFELLLEFLVSSSSGLGTGERAWLSSEVLESVFALFKRREGQQSRSGFTGLIVSLPTLLRSWSAAEVRAGLRRTDMETVNQWVEQTVGATLWSKRAQAFAHFGKKCPKFQPL